MMSNLQDIRRVSSAQATQAGLCYDPGHHFLLLLFLLLTPQGGVVRFLCCFCLRKFRVEANHWLKTEWGWL